MASRAVRIARGVIVQVAGRVLGIPLSIITLAIATRYLGTSDYGVLTTAVVFTGLFETFTELGIGTVIVRRVTGKGPGGTLHRLVGLNLTLSLGYALPLAVLSFLIGLLAYPGRAEVQLAIGVISIGLIFTTIASCFDPVFDVHVRYAAVAGAEITSRLVTFAAAVLVWWTDAGLLAMCAVQIAPQLIRLIISAFAARRLVRLRFVRAARELRSLLVESIPFTLIVLIGVVYWRADGVVLSLFSDPEQVGAYGMAYQIAFSLSLLPQVFSRSALSTINQGYDRDPPRFVAAIDSGYRFLLLCAAPVAVFGAVLAGRIVDAVGSEQFAEAATPVLRLFFIACAAQFLTPMITDALIAAHEQRYLTTLSACNLVANILLNLLLVPRLGAVGCGIALLASELSGVLFAQPRLRRIGVGYPPLGYLARLLPGLGLGVLAVWACWSLPLVVVLPACGIGYLAGAFLAGALPASMRATLFAAVRPGSARQATAEESPSQG